MTATQRAQVIAAAEEIARGWIEEYPDDLATIQADLWDTAWAEDSRAFDWLALASQEEYTATQDLYCETLAATLDAAPC